MRERDMAKNDEPTAKAAASAHKVVVVPRMTEDQLAFLRDISLTPADFDRSIVVGGPSRARPVSV